MDFHMKQERNQQELHESELEPEPSELQQQQYPCPKMPKLLHNHQYQHDHHHHHHQSSALPLFVPEPKITTTHNLSPYSDHATAAPTGLSKFPRAGSYFSWAQWQELELQAVIYRYMLAGAAVPPELLQPIKKSLLLSHSSAPPYFLHHPLHHFQPPLLQSGYWGRYSLDPEPGRCRRTDGKKWRCSRDVVGGHKYCERHMHRGRNRSRKHVETPTPASAAVGGGAGAGTPRTAVPISAQPQSAVAGGGGNHFALSGQSPSFHLLNFSQSKHEPNKTLFSTTQNDSSGNDRSGGRVLRHFFDDWPRSIQDPDGPGTNGGTSLSISMPANPSSDVSLKLSTGIGGDEPAGPGNGSGGEAQPNWGSGWASNHVSSMGGPLAEVLRSSTTTSTSSPTSVLHQLTRRSSVSDTSYVSA